MSRSFWCGICAAMAVALSGCLNALDGQTKKDEKSIIGKTTQDIGKHDADKPAETVSSKITDTNPVTAPLNSYGPIIQKAATVQIDHAVNLFHATEGRYPKDYDEFMEKIIKANNIKLPVLPFDRKYEYDEKNHTIVIVQGKPAGAGTAEKPDGSK